MKRILFINKNIFFLLYFFFIEERSIYHSNFVIHYSNTSISLPPNKKKKIEKTPCFGYDETCGIKGLQSGQGAVIQKPKQGVQWGVK